MLNLDKMKETDINQYKFIIPILTLFLTWNCAVSQGLIPGGYESLSLSEYVWSKSKTEFIEIEKIKDTSFFGLNPKGLVFKKRNQDWLRNEWKPKEKQKSDFITGVYIDALNQRVIVYPDKKEIWYYWGNERGSNNYSNLTIYHEIRRNDEVINAYLKWRQKGGEVIPFEISQAMENEEYQTVIKLSTEIINSTDSNKDENALLFYLMALSFDKLGDCTNAIDNFNQVIAIWGDKKTSGETYYSLGYCEFQIGNFESSIKNLTKAIEKGNTLAYPIRAAAFSKSQNHKNALKDFEIAEKLGVMDNSSYYYYYGFSYMELGATLYNSKQYDNSKVDFRNAIEQFERATQIDPNSWAAFKMKGKCYEMCGDYSKAVESYKKSLSIRDYQPEVQGYVNRLNRLLEEKKENYVKLKKENGVYKVPVSLNGIINIDFIFDSGAGEVLIAPEVAMVLLRSKTIDDDDKLEDGYFEIADGSVLRLSRFNIKEVQVGSKKIFNVKCAVSKEFGGDMLLGQSVLEKLGKYTFDYEKMRLIFN